MRRDFIVSVLGIGMGQLVVLLSTPILARIYTPAQFGQYATLVALSGIIATGAALRLEIAIPSLADSEVNQVSALAYALPVLSVSLICLLFPFNALNFVPFLKGISQINLGNLWAVSCLQSITAVSLGYCTRYGYFRLNATIKILQPTFFVVSALSWRSGGLPGALIIGWAAAMFAGYYAMRKLNWVAAWKKALATLSQKWEYPLISLPVALLDTLTLSLPLFFIVSTYGDISGGNYSQVQRLAAAPLILAGIAAGQVFYKHGGDLYRSNNCIAPLMWRTVMKLAGGGCVLLLMSWFIAEPIFRLFLGRAWRIDTYFIVLVLLPVVFRMAVSPVSSVFLICNRVALGGCWQLLYFVWSFPMLYFASKYLEFDRFLAVLAGSEFVMYLVYLMFAKVAVSNPNRKIAVA